MKKQKNPDSTKISEGFELPFQIGNTYSWIKNPNIPFRLLQFFNPEQEIPSRIDYHYKVSQKILI